MKRIASLLATAAFFVGTSTHAAEKGNLKILFVGSDPAKVIAGDDDRMFSKNPEDALALKKERTPAFEALLKQNFKAVKVVYAPDYREAMSVNYDVTIFDQVPPKIKDEYIDKDATGKPIAFHPAQYLSPGFSAATLLIAVNAAKIGEPLEYKMDLLCECLGAHAHDIKFDHPIFNTPNKVKLTVESRPTPANYSEYYSGRNLPATLPMWRVQEQSFEDAKGMPPGLVSSGQGYTEGKDAEIIAGGTNEKSRQSVSLSRHGNFFHWGYSASPAHMTDEAKLVFVNSIYYVSQFKGDLPYSHRPFRGAFGNRQFALNLAYILKHQTYEDWVKQQEEGHKRLEEVAERLKSSGVKLTDEQLKNMAPPLPPMPDRATWVKSVALQMQPQSAIALFGTNLDKYLPYYEENLPYLIPGTAPYTFEVDTDVRSLGVANNDPQLMALCVSMLESNLDTDKALRILKRYSGQNFGSTQEWRKWIDANHGNLYFSDENGYRFHVVPDSFAKQRKSAAKAG